MKILPIVLFALVIPGLRADPVPANAVQVREPALPAAAPAKPTELDQLHLAVTILQQQRNKLATDLQDAQAQILYLQEQLKLATTPPTPAPAPPAK